MCHHFQCRQCPSHPYHRLARVFGFFASSLVEAVSLAALARMLLLPEVVHSVL
jgi:hypothetical protein